MLGFDLPPLMLIKSLSLEALIVAIRLLTTRAESLSRELESAQRKCSRSCPKRAAERQSRRDLTPRILHESHSRSDFDVIHQAIRPSACSCCIIVTKRGNFQRVRFSWGCFSGENAGYWRHGVNCAMTIAVWSSDRCLKIVLTGKTL